MHLVYVFPNLVAPETAAAPYATGDFQPFEDGSGEVAVPRASVSAPTFTCRKTLVRDPFKQEIPAARADPVCSERCRTGCCKPHPVSGVVPPP